MFVIVQFTVRYIVSLLLLHVFDICPISVMCFFCSYQLLK